MQKYASFRFSLYIKFSFFRTSFLDCRHSILKWLYRTNWFKFLRLMTGLFLPSFFLLEICCSQIDSLVVILQKLVLLQPSSRDFLSLMKLPLGFFGWNIFPLEFPFCEVDIRRGFDNPSQLLNFLIPCRNLPSLLGEFQFSCYWHFRKLFLQKQLFYQYVSV